MCDNDGFKDGWLVNHPPFGLAFWWICPKRKFFLRVEGRSCPFEVKIWQYFTTHKEKKTPPPRRWNEVLPRHLSNRTTRLFYCCPAYCPCGGVRCTCGQHWTVENGTRTSFMSPHGPPELSTSVHCQVGNPNANARSQRG